MANREGADSRGAFSKPQIAFNAASVARIAGNVLLLTWLSISAVFAEEERYNFVFESVELRELVRLVYFDAFRTNVVIDGDLRADSAAVTLFARGVKEKELRQLISGLLASSGYEETTSGGFTSFRKRVAPEEAGQDFFYEPLHRSVSYLVDVLGAQFGGDRFSTKRGVSDSPEKVKTGKPKGERAEMPGSAQTFVDRAPDGFVFRGTASDVKRLQGLLAQVDRPSPEVMVRATIYEVAKSDSKEDGLSIALRLLGGKINAAFGPPVDRSNLRFSSATLDVAFAALNADTRFKVASQPSLRVRSGARARLTVGADVPVLGQAVRDDQGRSTNSVEYKSAGVILEITPNVRRDVIDMDLQQTVSTFGVTTSGVNGSPTFLKRELSTSISLHGGEAVLLGGLNESRATSDGQSNRWLPWIGTRTGSDSNTELLVFLHVERVPG